MSKKLHFMFIHGLLSGTGASKAVSLGELVKPWGTFEAVNLYGTATEFYQMTISNCIAKVDTAIEKSPAPVVLIGSSHGGLIAARLLHVKTRNYSKVAGLILTAPALSLPQELEHFSDVDWRLLSTEEENASMATWLEKGFLTLFHPLLGKVQWSWAWMEDAKNNHFDPIAIIPTIPCLIIHGESDSLVNPEGSRKFLEQQSFNWKGVFIPRGDHSLSNVEPQMLDVVQHWLELHWP